MEKEFNFYDLCSADEAEKVLFEFQNTIGLKYGENPQQEAKLYQNDYCVDFEVLNDKELSYNDILDMNTALSLASEFFDVHSCICTKHTSPCAVALGKNIKDAFTKAMDCDPLSAINSTIAFTKTIDEECAKLLSQIQFNIIIAPDFSPSAFKLLNDKDKYKIVKIKTPLKDYKNFLKNEIKVTPFGVLIQNANKTDLDKNSFKVVSKTKPTQEMAEDMIFAWKIAKHAKSAAIVIAKDFKTLAIVQGQTNRIEAIEYALNKACDGSKDAVLASDGSLETKENVFAAVQGRIKGIIHTGGSEKDKDIIAAANKYETVMITTGIRQYKH